jgi:pSer/pThr/pTyr-binding forkhead associated (FHA) protein
MANTKHCLVIALPEGSVQHYLLSAREITIGRSAENSIVLDWDTVSSRHCTLRLRGKRYEVTDNGSTNGTVLRGESVKDEPRVLRNGDSLVIGLNVKARLVSMEEITDPPSGEEPVDGAATRKLKSSPNLPAMPSINPVAAAVAKAGRGKR